MDIWIAHMMNSLERWSLWSRKKISSVPINILSKGLIFQACFFGPAFGAVATVYESTWTSDLNLTRSMATQLILYPVETMAFLCLIWGSTVFGSYCSRSSRIAMETCEAGHFQVSEPQMYTDISFAYSSLHSNAQRVIEWVFGASCQRTKNQNIALCRRWKSNAKWHPNMVENTAK